MVTKVFNALPPEAVEIRTAVFVEEQGFANEFDDIDNSAVHIVLFEGETPISVCRFFYDESHKSYMIGRVAVANDWRKSGIGRKTVEAAENELRKISARSAMVSAQCRVQHFYEELGYKPFGEVYLDESCPHILMKKEF